MASKGYKAGKKLVFLCHRKKHGEGANLKLLISGSQVRFLPGSPVFSMTYYFVLI